MTAFHGNRGDTCQRHESNSPRPSAQRERLPSIPEEELLMIAEDTSRSSKQADVHTDALETKDLLFSWCHNELQCALDTLIGSEYSAPFVHAQSNSSMSLQSIEQGLQDGKYVNNADLFWSDVATCLDTSERSCDAQHTVAHFARCSMAMCALAEQLESEFWVRLSASNQCHLDEGAWGNEEVWEAAYWVWNAAVDGAEWLLFDEVSWM